MCICPPVMFRAVFLKVGTCQKFKFSDLTADLLNQKLWGWGSVVYFNKTFRYTLKFEDLWLRPRAHLGQWDCYKHYLTWQCRVINVVLFLLVLNESAWNTCKLSVKSKRKHLSFKIHYTFKEIRFQTLKTAIPLI